MKKELYTSVVSSSARPIIFNDELCVGCNRCADICQVDVMVHSVNKGEHPIVMYPGECWYCGACVMECPVKGAIKLQHPLMNEAKFVDAKKEPL